MILILSRFSPLTCHQLCSHGNSSSHNKLVQNSKYTLEECLIESVDYFHWLWKFTTSAALFWYWPALAAPLSMILDQHSGLSSAYWCELYDRWPIFNECWLGSGHWFLINNLSISIAKSFACTYDKKATKRSGLVQDRWFLCARELQVCLLSVIFRFCINGMIFFKSPSWSNHHQLVTKADLKIFVKTLWFSLLGSKHNCWHSCLFSSLGLPLQVLFQDEPTYTDGSCVTDQTQKHGA